RYIKIIWLTGAIAMFIHYLIIYILYSCRLSNVDVYKDEEAIEVLENYRHQMNIKRSVSIKIYGDIPLLKGILRPVIVLPEDYKSENLQHMLVHELCHFKYKHIFLNTISTVILCINWYNPI